MPKAEAIVLLSVLVSTISAILVSSIFIRIHSWVHFDKAVTSCVPVTQHVTSHRNTSRFANSKLECSCETHVAFNIVAGRPKFNVMRAQQQAQPSLATTPTTTSTCTQSAASLSESFVFTDTVIGGIGISASCSDFADSFCKCSSI